VGDWQDEHEHRYLVHFSDGGSGMRYFTATPEVGETITDGRESYTVERIEERVTRGGFGHVWAVLRE
jgi:hypothetical protein